MRQGFWMVPHLERNDSSVILRRVGHDVGEVPIQGQQNSVDFLGFAMTTASADSTGKTFFKRKTS